MQGLMLHTGDQLASREEVFKAPLPRATATYMPLANESFVVRLEKQLQIEGITIKEQQFALAKEGQRMFGLMELEFPNSPVTDYRCVLGLRNSYDRSFATEICVGAHVLVCTNLSFSGDIQFSRKHTPGLIKDLSWFLTETMAQLPIKFAAQSKAFGTYRQTELADRQVNDLLIRLFDAGALNITDIPHVLKEWREPRHLEFAQEGRTAWRLFNAATETIKGYDLWRLPARTTKIHHVLDAECGLVGTQEVAEREPCIVI